MLVTSLMYLDDWLLFSRTREKSVRITLEMMKDMGWLVNLHKSNINPTQMLTWLGIEWSMTFPDALRGPCSKVSAPTLSLQHCLLETVREATTYPQLRCRHCPTSGQAAAQKTDQGVQIQLSHLSQRPTDTTSTLFTPTTLALVTSMNLVEDHSLDGPAPPQFW
ncbi:hypothetical protein Pmani_037908 [Petrolisthes manimaculis]|uniref:Reverse transcriptase domain-containing protein n=1 Tax=Petrolisthes manimaculis TaxID=1843537 RepID=A0AAE1NFW3_9EUCA|nr:hypothetical protein Pmani_037908 [Petrolisthes manimaculis]